MSSMTVNPGSTTWFDDTFRPTSVPRRLTGGDHPEIVVMDGFARGQGIVGRSNAVANLIGVKVDSSGQPVRVRLEVSVDDATVNWWRKRAAAEFHGLSPYASRFLRISSQGDDKGVLHLARRPLDGTGPTRGWLEFDVPGGQVDPEGLLMIGIDGMGIAGSPSILPDPVLGIRVDALDIDVAGGAIGPQLSGGDSRRPMLRGNRFAFSPVSDAPESVTLELVPDLVLPPVIAQRLGKYRRISSRLAAKGVKEASNATRRLLRQSGLVERAIASNAFDAWAQDLDGDPVGLRLTAAGTDGRDLVEVVFPGGAGPVIGGLSLDPSLLRTFGYPTTSNWSVVHMGASS